MAHCLTLKEIIALSFMTFALFVGAGNIIFPPMVGLQSGEHVWIAAFGFLITAVGLPVIAIIALARAQGGIDTLSKPIGKVTGMLLATVCYLTIGPLFATPRTATVSFEVGIAPLTGNSSLALLLYSLIYFALVVSISIYPSKLLDIVGHILAPLKISALAVLGIAAIIWPAGNPIKATEAYQHTAFFSGFISGYLTMDTLGALVFGIVIINTIRSRGVEEANLLARYTILAGLITGVGLTLVYLSLFKLGSGSGLLTTQNANGAEILYAYVQYTFGYMGIFFLTALIFVSCIVTAVGLVCACAEFFKQYLPFSHKILVLIISLFSMAVSNLGLNHLIKVSIPVLIAIYPPCIVLIMLSFTIKLWNKSTRIIVPTIFTSFSFGIIDMIKGTTFKKLLPTIISQHLPLAEQNLSWLFPTIVVLFIAALVDRIMGQRVRA